MSPQLSTKKLSNVTALLTLVELLSKQLCFLQGFTPLVEQQTNSTTHFFVDT